MRACHDPRLGLLPVLLSLLAACATPPAPPPAALAPSPQDPWVARFQAAVAALERGETAAAVERLEALTAARPQWAGPWFNLGLARLALDRPEPALAALEAARVRRPQDPRIHVARGVALRRLGRLREAEAAYREALRLAPDWAPAHRNLAILLDLYLDRPQAALAHYRCYRELHPEDPQAQRWVEEVRRRLARQARRGEGRP